MNVIKFLAAFLFISINIFGQEEYNFEDFPIKEDAIIQDQYTNEVFFSFSITREPNTINESNIGFDFWAGYRYFLITHERLKEMKSNWFIESMLRLNFSSEDTHGDFIKEEKTFFQPHIGLGYTHSLKNKYIFSYFAGGKFLYSKTKYSVNDENAVGDFKYKGKEDILYDYGPYLGGEAGYLFGNDKFFNILALKSGIVLDYFYNLNELNLYVTFSVSYLF